MIDCEIEGTEFANCNCDYDCPCQFNALPTYGNYKAIAAYQIRRGHYGDLNSMG